VSPFLQTLQNSQAVGVTATPLVWIDFLKSHSEPVSTNLRYLTISGGTLSHLLEHKLRRIFPGVKIFKTYGQTETFRTFINDSESADLGRAISGVRFEVTPEGELIHYGNTAMLGYLFQPESSMQALNADGGVFTKDLVEVDDNGKIFLKGRRDDVIKRFEQRFHLSEVENVFKNLEAVHEAVAVCVEAPSEDWRQYYLGVFVELKPNANATGEDLLSQVQQRLSYFKIPDKVLVLPQFPQTVSHKVDRMQLKHILKAEVLT
ncbi:MAG TPA: AMP-binding protein, partial [Bdellovibrio sp.]